MAKIIHAMIRVLNEERSVDFYRRAFGLGIADRYAFDGFTLVYLRSAAADFEVELTINHDRTEPYSTRRWLRPHRLRRRGSAGRARALPRRGAGAGADQGVPSRGRADGAILLRAGPRRLSHRGAAAARPLSLTNQQERQGKTNMREIDRRKQVSRRGFLQGSATAVPAAGLAAAGMGISPHAAWAQAATNLKPHTMATLVLMARDIYPHDRLADIYYIKAVTPYDAKAGSDAAFHKMVETGVAEVDAWAQRAAQGQLPDGALGNRPRRRAGRPPTGPAVQEAARRPRGEPLQPAGGVAEIRLRGRLGRQGRLHPSRLQRPRLAAGNRKGGMGQWRHSI